MPRGKRARRPFLPAATAAVLCFARPGAVQAGWIDAATPESEFATTCYEDGNHYELVFSDEFEDEGRTFDDGQDPRWTAIDKNDYTNAALQYYSKDNIITRDGMLEITTENTDVEFEYWNDKTKSFSPMKKVYKSGMLQSWNKFCFTGGVIEVSARLPGTSDIGGLWPAIWLLGNLARATYTSSSDWIWPWSYNQCDYSTANRRGWQHQQETSACDISTHYGFAPQTGRGAPEIDILEAMAGYDPYDPLIAGKPYVSNSFQVSPGTPADSRPVEGKFPQPGEWYEEGMTYGENTTMNVYFMGTELKHSEPGTSYWADAISANHRISETHFEHHHVYRVEWVPGNDGYVNWYIDGNFSFGLTAGTLNRTGAQIPMEPMYILFNTAVSSMWGMPAPCPPGCPCECYDAREPKCSCAIPKNMDLIFPATFQLDWVRVYQAPDDDRQNVGCSTEAYPTARWIKGHHERYMDPSDTHILYDVPTGGGSCRHDSNCHEGGSCAKRKCVCAEGRAGPTCQSPDGYDDSEYQDWDNTLPEMEPPYVPVALATGMALLVGSFALTLIVRRSHRRKRLELARMDEALEMLPPHVPVGPGGGL